jgi:hypothetical protein
VKFREDRPFAECAPLAFAVNGPEREKLLMLAECFRELADIKGLVLRKVN